MVQILQERIQELERNQHAVNAAATSPYTGQSHEAASVEATSHREADELATRKERGTKVSAILAAVTGEPQYEGFQGPSSAATFMSSIRQAVDENAKSPDSSFVVGLAPQTPPSPSSFVSNQQTVPRDYVLPPRRVVDGLLQSYWTLIHPLYPVLNRSIFNKSYDALWAGNLLSIVASPLMRVDESTLVCILNLLLALACQYSDEIALGKAFATAQVFFNRGRKLFDFDAVDSTDNSLPHLQIMLLIAQYLQCTGRAYKAWNTIAIAIRSCHQMGFHLAATSSEERFPDVVERELVKRVYHFCLTSER